MIEGTASPRIAFPWHEADAMFLVLVKRLSAIRDCGLGSADEEEWDTLIAAIDAYEARRWPRLADVG